MMAAAFLLSLGAAASAFAQRAPDSAGIVRITDGGVRSSGPQSGGRSIQQTGGYRGGMSGTPCQDGSCQFGNQVNGNQVNGNMAGGYSTGNCPAGGNCPSGRCMRCRGCLSGKFCEHYCKHSPDYGYSPPSQYPLLRRGAEYTNYYPAAWYGAGADYSHSQAPMVYQPTDTTQLGFYYQHVPYWQPQPNMVPPRPIPAEWHITPPAMQASNWAPCYSIGHGCQHRRFGHRGYSGGYGVKGDCPADGTVMNQGVSPQPIKSEAAVPSGPPRPAPVDTDATGSPEVLPMESEAPESGTQPTALPPTTSLPPSPGGIGSPEIPPLPTISATGGQIRRIGQSN